MSENQINYILLPLTAVGKVSVEKMGEEGKCFVYPRVIIEWGDVDNPDSYAEKRQVYLKRIYASSVVFYDTMTLAWSIRKELRFQKRIWR